jgi:hypothetical protein
MGKLSIFLALHEFSSVARKPAISIRRYGSMQSICFSLDIEHRASRREYMNIVDIVSHWEKREKHRLDETGTDSYFQKMQGFL